MTATLFTLRDNTSGEDAPKSPISMWQDNAGSWITTQPVYYNNNDRSKTKTDLSRNSKPVSVYDVDINAKSET
jgi:hypothetical protein